MKYEKLRQAVYEANVGIVKAGLVVLTWGNASGVDRTAEGGGEGGAGGVMAIKPSGVEYDKLTPADIVIVSLATGKVVDGAGRPSSDTPTHWHLYRSFPSVGGVVHTHSLYATSFAQAQRDLPCLGTTHADHFYGTVPVTRAMTAEEIATEYELNTGKVIVETFHEKKIDAAQIPAVLVASHGPFAWGTDVMKAMENAIVLESVARMQLQSYQLNAGVKAIPAALLDKHYLRKHGANAYYGQKA